MASIEGNGFDFSRYSPQRAVFALLLLSGMYKIIQGPSPASSGDVAPENLRLARGNCTWSQCERLCREVGRCRNSRDTSGPCTWCKKDCDHGRWPCPS